MKNRLTGCFQTKKMNGFIGYSPSNARCWVPAGAKLGEIVGMNRTVDIEFDDFEPKDGIVFVRGLQKITALNGGVLFEAEDHKILLSSIRALVDSAVAAGAKRIKFRLESDVVIRYCGPRSKYHGKLVVQHGEQFYGFIELDGNWDVVRAPAGVAAAVAAFNADPAKAAKLSAAHTGSCCFCGRFLENDGSIEAGYGPVCAGKFGLPWQDHATGSIELTEDEKASLPLAHDSAADRSREAAEAY